MQIAPPHPARVLERCPAAGAELWSLATHAAEGRAAPLEAIRRLRAPEAGLEGPRAGHLRALADGPGMYRAEVRLGSRIWVL